MTLSLYLEGASLAMYQSIVLWTLTGMVGHWLVERVVRDPAAGEFARPLGFGILMAVVPWFGFSGLGRIPGLWEVVGIGVFWWGVYRLGKNAGQFQKGLRAYRLEDLRWLSIPILTVGTILFSKRCYLIGGVNNVDEFRSLLLVGSVANNGLLPSFPFDASAPISYSYGVFAVGGLLYRMVHGQGFPAVPTLVVNGFISIYFFRLLFVLCRRVFARDQWLAFALVATTVTCYGFDFLMLPPGASHIEWWTNFQIAQSSSLHIFTYQYVWASITSLTALVCFHRFVMKAEMPELRLAALFLVSAALAGAITFVWAVLSLVGVVVAAVVFHSEKLKGLQPSKAEWISIGKLGGLCIFLLLPQVFTYLARDTLFSFSLYPRYWESRQFIFSSLWWTHLVQALRDALVDMGPFLLAALFASVFYWVRPRRWPVQAVAPFLGIIAAGSVLMTFSFSTYFDWTARGFLVAMLALPFVFAHLVLPYRGYWTKPWALGLIVLVMLPQAYNFLFECRLRSNTCHAPPHFALAWNESVPFESFVHARTREQVDILGFAGRAMITPAHANQLYTYLNNPSFLDRYVGWKRRFVPCQQTRFGKSTPSNKYVEISPDGASIEIDCPAPSSSASSSLSRR